MIWEQDRKFQHKPVLISTEQSSVKTYNSKTFTRHCHCVQIYSCKFCSICVIFLIKPANVNNMQKRTYAGFFHIGITVIAGRHCSAQLAATINTTRNKCKLFRSKLPTVTQVTRYTQYLCTMNSAAKTETIPCIQMFSFQILYKWVSQLTRSSIFSRRLMHTLARCHEISRKKVELWVIQHGPLSFLEQFLNFIKTRTYLFFQLFC